MSGPFLVNIGSLEEIALAIGNNSVTVIVDGSTQAYYVPWLAVGENNGGTPNLTVDLYDGTTAYPQSAGGSCWNAKAVTTKQGVLFDQGIVVPKGWSLRVTSSDASGHMTVTGAKARRSG